MQQDKIIIQTTKTHRSRLSSALSFGALGRRRPVNTNMKRLIGSVVLAAVAGVGCIGYGFVMDLLLRQREEAAIESFQQVLASNPLPETETRTLDEDTGFLVDSETGEWIDPRTGYIVDPETMLATDPNGEIVDPRMGWYYDPDTGYYTDPKTGVVIDPVTLEPVRGEQ
ncbi:OCRE domain-containing protein [Pseudactinotalea sp.]|uniref:OCRE domain-containing protein n=1 Tax=Pseudactinotalea sp. TaxID=1926260 RepID=UPI003B3A8318